MIVNHKRSGVLNADGVVLKPGPNQVDIKAWENSRKHPMIKKLMDLGEIVEESEFDENLKLSAKEEKSADETILSPMKIPQAKALVEETVDLELLEQWKKSEKRNQVIGSINSQIDKLKAPAEERDRSESRQVSTGKGPIEVQVRNPGDVEQN